MPDRPFEVKEASGAGLGAFATRPIKAGELILAEEPIAFVTASGNIALNTDYRDDLTVDEAKRVILELTSTECEKTLSGIMTSNAYEVNPELGMSGLFPLISRLNHSCFANVNHYWVPQKSVSEEQAEFERENGIQSGRLCLRALRDIKAGEQLCTDYLPPNLTFSQRQEALQTRYGFKCRCVLCTSKNISENDKRRRLCESLDEQIPKSRNAHEALERAELLLRVIRAEGALTQKVLEARALHDRFQVAAPLWKAKQLSDEKMRGWAKEAHAALTICRGPDALDFSKPHEALLQSLLEE